LVTALSNFLPSGGQVIIPIVACTDLLRLLIVTARNSGGLFSN